MYVCLCQGVTDQDISDAVSAGAQSLADIQRELGAATGCGTCREFTEKLLDSALGDVSKRAGQLGYAA